MSETATYQGRPVTDLTRDELIEAYTTLRRLFVEHVALQREIVDMQRLLASKRPTF
jgi:hypothetical protein